MHMLETTHTMTFYYNKVDLSVHTNRIDAYNDPHPCLFYYYDKEFASADWRTEPKKSLKELYKERAQAIRDQYEYLILAFSGGHDSSNVLESFYYNGIHIDEILMVGAFSQDGYTGSDENHNAEIYKSAIPILNKLELRNTKITKKDYAPLLDNIENFSVIRDYGSDWIKHIGAYYSVHTMFWRDIQKHITIPEGKLTGMIFGTEKPNFLIDPVTKVPYTQFNDIQFTPYGNFKDTENLKRISFYSSIDSTEIMRKQLHIILEFFIRNCLVTKELPVKVFFDNYSKIIHRLIYPLNIPIPIVTPKSTNNILSIRDTYLIKNKTADIYKIYKDGISKLTKFDLGSYKAINPFISRRYTLCDSLAQYY